MTKLEQEFVTEETLLKYLVERFSNIKIAVDKWNPWQESFHDAKKGVNYGHFVSKKISLGANDNYTLDNSKFAILYELLINEPIFTWSHVPTKIQNLIDKWCVSDPDPVYRVKTKLALASEYGYFFSYAWLCNYADAPTVDFLYIFIEEPTPPDANAPSQVRKSRLKFWK